MPITKEEFNGREVGQCFIDSQDRKCNVVRKHQQGSSTILTVAREGGREEEMMFTVGHGEVEGIYTRVDDELALVPELNDPMARVG